MNNSHENSVRDLLKGLSSRDFLKIGVDEVAYIRPISLSGNDKGFAIYAADGTQLSVLETMDMAIAALRHNDLMAVTLH